MGRSRAAVVPSTQGARGRFRVSVSQLGAGETGPLGADVGT